MYETLLKGRHLTVDMYGCGNMSNFNEIYRFLEVLPTKIDMKALTSPILVLGAEHNPGITGFIIIETSHISIHTFENTKNISFDIYSCKDFDSTPIIEELQTFFMPVQQKVNEVVREI